MRLQAHPLDTKTAPFQELFARLQRMSQGLVFEYEIRNLKSSLVKWPPLFSLPQRRDDLWKSTCFEAFLKPQNQASYWEFNFSPEGFWNCYSFTGLRHGMKPEPRLFAPVFHFETRGYSQIFRIEVDLPKEFGELRKDLNYSMTAVCETNNGDKSYWAASHPEAKPDFHDSTYFKATLEAE